jgi:hypothetical protein
MNPLVDVEQRGVLAHRAPHHRDDHLVVQLGGTPDHVEVAVGHRVVGARTDGY